MWQAIIVACLLVYLPLATQAEPEEISVTGTRSVQVSAYQRIARIYRRYDKIPAARRPDMTIGVAGILEPGDRPVQDAMPYLATAAGRVPLFGPRGNEMTVPITDVLWAENPPIRAPLHPGEEIRVWIVFHIAVPRMTTITNVTAHHWLDEFADSTENVVGILGSALAPDAHKLAFLVAPQSRLSVTQGGVTSLLVSNQGATPYRYVFRPQDFRTEAIFTMDRPLSGIDLISPVDFVGHWGRKAP